MTNRNMRAIAAALIAVAAAMPLAAHDYKLKSLAIAHPWARETPAGAKVGGGYLKITNAGSKPDWLLGGSTPVADKLELHGMTMDGNIMRMRAVTGGLRVPAQGGIELKPGGYHIMLVGLRAPLKRGTMIPATLRFAKAGEVKVAFKVEPLGLAAPTTGGHAHGTH